MAIENFMNRCVVTKGCSPTAQMKFAREMIVLLLGWAGAKDTHLAKYSKIYENRGLTTLRYTVVTPKSVWRSLPVSKRLTAPLMPALDSLLEGNSRRILLHMFSMNSVFALSSLLNNYGMMFMDRTSAVVLDSCPALYDTTALAHALDSILPQRFPSLSSPQLTALKFSILGFAHLNEYKNKFLNAIDGKFERRSYYHWLGLKANLPMLQLYIYSKADVICRHEIITEFREDQVMRRGASAKYLLLEDSSHVEHFRRYEDLYSRTINEFVDSVVFSSQSHI